MNKGNSLREFLCSAVAELREDPSRLSIFADKGHVVATGTASLCYEYRYTLQLLLLDFAGDLDAVFTPILAWIATNQPELLANFDKQPDAIRFDAELLDNRKADLSIELPLTERIRVEKQPDGRLVTTYLPEPDYPAEIWWGFNPDAPAATHLQLYARDELVAEWPAP